LGVNPHPITWFDDIISNNKAKSGTKVQMLRNVTGLILLRPKGIQ